MKKLLKNEKGNAIVEATFIFPIVILTTLAFYFLIIYMYNRVNLQKSLDLYMEVCSKSVAVANQDYGSPLSVTIKPTPLLKPKNPYRNFTSSNDLSDELEQAVLNYAKQGSLFASNNDDVNIQIKNYILFKEIKGSAARTFKMPINLSLIGIDSNVTIYAASRRMVQDHDEFMRNVDLVIDATSYFDEKYGISDKIGGIKDKVGKVFSKNKEK
ncbi:MAG: hypothetical protein RR234_02065 [Christensenella sp.]